MKGQIFCMYAYDWIDRNTAEVFRQDDGFLEPHVDCLMNKEEML